MPKQYPQQRPDRSALSQKLLAEGRCVEALAEAKLGFAEAESQGDKPLMARRLVQIAWCCMKLGEAEAGLECVLGARRLQQYSLSAAEQARTAAVEAFLLLDLGLSDEAFETAELAVSMAEAGDDDAVTAFAYNVKGVTLALCRQAELGAALLQRAVILARDMGDDTGQAYHLLNLAFCQIKLADDAEAAGDRGAGQPWLAQAIGTNDAAISLAQVCGDLWTLRTALANGAEYQARRGDLDQALAALAASAALPGEPGTSLRIHYLYTLGDVQLRAGQLEPARITCGQALTLADASNQIDHQLNAVERLCAVHEALGDFQTALALHRRFHTLYVRQSGETTLRRAKVAEIRLESEELRARANELAMQAMLDPLTGIANRRSFDQILARLDGSPYALGIVDLDLFKAINDRFSHQVGDAVLVRVARIMVDQIGADGHAVRLGGEEFALVFPGVAAAKATALCDAIRCAIAETDWSDIAEGLHATVSIGMAAGVGELVTVADRRLYDAKRQGRNCVVGCDGDALALVG